MQTLIDFDRAPVFAIPTVEPIAGITVREGMLLEGPQGWGEFSPLPWESSPTRWLTAATEPGTVGWPDPVRGRVRVAVTVPAVEPERARGIAASSGCRTAAVEVGTGDPADDVDRIRAVRDGLGPGGIVRCNARGRWDVEAAVAAITSLDRAAGGLEFVTQPCRTRDELAAVRRRVDVPVAIAAGATHGDPALPVEHCADIAVLVCGPSGGVRRALRFAESCGLPCMVGSSLETTIGLAAGVALAGALPHLPFACELGTRELLAGDLVAESRSLSAGDGCLPVAPMPPAPQPELLDRYAVTDPDRVAFWRDRLHAARTAARANGSG